MKPLGQITALAISPDGLLLQAAGGSAQGFVSFPCKFATSFGESLARFVRAFFPVHGGRCGWGFLAAPGIAVRSIRTAGPN